jgi:hypothetical protein
VWIYVAAAVGGAAFLVTWATGLNSEVGGIIWLGIIAVGILAEMQDRARRGNA